MNKSIPYALQVGTLAIWLSCFLGAVIGFCVKQEWVLAILPKPKTIALQTSIALEAPMQQALTEEILPSPAVKRHHSRPLNRLLHKIFPSSPS